MATRINRAARVLGASILGLVTAVFVSILLTPMLGPLFGPLVSLALGVVVARYVVD